jgi:hypothetical protein
VRLPLVAFPVDCSHAGLFANMIGWRSTTADCFAANAEVHVPHERVPAPGPPRSRGQGQRARYTAGQRMSDVAVDRRSSLLFPCFSYTHFNVPHGQIPCRARAPNDNNTQLGGALEIRAVALVGHIKKVWPSGRLIRLTTSSGGAGFSQGKKHD